MSASDSWQLSLSSRQQTELIDLGLALGASHTPLDHASKYGQHHPAPPALQLALEQVREALRDGPGFMLMRGFPVHALSRDTARLAYAALGSWLGEAVAQNRGGELLHDVRDTGADPQQPTTRLSTTRAEQDFHTDGADLIGLLCLQGARSGGLSRIVSSVTVFEEVARQRPDLAPLLFAPWPFHLKGEQAPGSPPWMEMPIVQRVGDSLSSFFLGWYIRDSQQLAGAPRLTAEQQQLLTLYEQTANREDLYLDMAFAPGDVQWLKNAVILHKRTAYEDDPARPRHLLRLWLAVPTLADGILQLRRGHEAAARQAEAARVA